MYKKAFTLFTGALVGIFLIFTSAFAAVDLNKASQSELQALKGVGPAKAQAIVEYRNQHGSFKTIDDLANVKGFGKKTIESLRDQITIEPDANGAAPAKETAQVK